MEKLKADVYLETKKSSKTGKDYKVLVIQLENNYKLEMFLNYDQMYIVESLKK